MKTIYKYTPARNPNTYGEFSLQLPYGCNVLSVAIDPQGVLCIYAEVNTEEQQTQEVLLYVLGTGKEFINSSRKELYKFLGTVIQGPFVWHVYYQIV